MSTKLMIKDNHIKSNDQDDHLTPIVDIKCSKLSEREISDIQTLIFRRIRSENKIQSNVNYDDLCGSWIYPENPLYARYIKPLDSSLCVWKYFTEEDLVYLKKHQQNKDVICSFFANKFFVENVEKSDNILIEILWEFFKFARLHLFTEKGISGLLGVVYSTHIFFLSHPWLKAKDVYQFFYKTVLLHVVLDPPKSMEIFTVAECKLLFKAFHKMYIKNLVLFHILCHPHYYFTMNLHNLTSSVYNNE